MLLFPLHIKQQNGLLHYTPLRKAQMIYFKCLLKLPIFQSFILLSNGKENVPGIKRKMWFEKTACKNVTLLKGMHFKINQMHRIIFPFFS